MIPPDIVRMERLLRPGFPGQGQPCRWFSSGDGLVAGLENRTDPAAYRWDGLARGGDHRRPKVLFQFTLAGNGAFQGDDRPVQDVVPGQGFLTLIPSRHCYWLPPEEPSWRFFWVIFHHPYATERIATALAAAGTPAGQVLDLAGDPRLVAATVALFGDLVAQRLTDCFLFEERVVAFALAAARRLGEGVNTTVAPDPLVALVQRVAESRPGEMPGIVELARRAGLSRGHFTTCFRAATGTSPGRYLLRLRLEAAKRAVEASDQPLVAIARAHGFVDERHLRRAFLRQFHIRPSDCRPSRSREP